MPIGSASILDKLRMYSRGRHDRSRCREVEFGPDEIMESSILIYDLVLNVSSILLRSHATYLGRRNQYPNSLAVL